MALRLQTWMAAESMTPSRGDLRGRLRAAYRTSSSSDSSPEQPPSSTNYQDPPGDVDDR